MESTLSEQESVALTYLRVFAMTCIVVCHFMQSLGNQLAWVFNLGVQVFLLISGFLYGHKHVDGWIQWFYKRCTRIYLPFIVFIIAIIPIYAINNLITWKHIIVYIADMQGIMGGG